MFGSNINVDAMYHPSTKHAEKLDTTAWLESLIKKLLETRPLYIGTRVYRYLFIYSILYCIVLYDLVLYCIVWSCLYITIYIVYPYIPHLSKKKPEDSLSIFFNRCKYIYIYKYALFQPKFRPGRCGFSHCAKPPRILSSASEDEDCPTRSEWQGEGWNNDPLWSRTKYVIFLVTVSGLERMCTDMSLCIFLLTWNRWWNHLDEWTRWITPKLYTCQPWSNKS